MKNAKFVYDIPIDVPSQLILDTIDQQPHPLQPAQIGGKGLATDIRSCYNKGVYGPCWINGMIMHYINRINDAFFRYDIYSLDKDMTNYLQYGPSDHYKWHIDSREYSQHVRNDIHTNKIMHDTYQYVRKLSFSLLLSDPHEYDGGELQFNVLGLPLETYKPPAGTLLVFDSRLPHRVRPIKHGTRKSLVGWVIGPFWK